MGREEIVGTAVETELAADMTSGSTSFTVVDASGWPTGGGGDPFVVTIGKGTASEEKILCTSRTGTTIAVTTRGYDGTTAAAHSTGVNVIHSISAALLNEANAHVNDDTRDDHSQYQKVSTLTESVQDIVGALVVAGADVTVTYNDGANTLTIAVTSLTERVQDVVGAFLTAGSDITVTYDDAGNTLTVAVTALTERIQDVIGALIVDSSSIDVTYDDAGNAFTVVVKAGGVTAAMHATGTRPVFVVADATARLALSPADGDLAVETSTDRWYGYTGTAWRYLRGGTNPTACRAYATGATSCTGGAVTKILFGALSYDYGSNYTTDYAAPEAGDYEMFGRTGCAGQTTSERIFASIYVNGAEVARGVDVTCGTAGATGLASTVRCRLTLAAGDVVTLRLFTSVTHNSDAGSALSYLEVVRV